MLIWLSESRLLGWFYYREISLIVIIKVRSHPPPGLIIKGLDNQARKCLIIRSWEAVMPRGPEMMDDSWNAFWRRGLRWWRECINISIQTCQSRIEPSYISARYSTQGSRTTTCGSHTSTFRMHSYAHSLYSFVRLMTGRLTCCLFCRQKYNLKWGLHQLREVWTRNFKSSAAEEDGVVKCSLPDLPSFCDVCCRSGKSKNSEIRKWFFLAEYSCLRINQRTLFGHSSWVCL